MRRISVVAVTLAVALGMTGGLVFAQGHGRGNAGGMPPGQARGNSGGGSPAGSLGNTGMQRMDMPSSRGNAPLGTPHASVDRDTGRDRASDVGRGRKSGFSNGRNSRTVVAGPGVRTRTRSFGNQSLRSRGVRTGNPGVRTQSLAPRRVRTQGFGNPGVRTDGARSQGVRNPK
jgi:hypothetical protein